MNKKTLYVIRDYETGGLSDIFDSKKSVTKEAKIMVNELLDLEDSEAEVTVYKLIPVAAFRGSKIANIKCTKHKTI